MTPDLERIKPDASGKFSPALYRFLRSRRAQQYGYNRVYRETSAHTNESKLSINEIIIGGAPDDTAFIHGSILGCILRGTRPKFYAFSVRGLGLRDITDEFWAKYERVGRCAWDPSHSLPMLNEGDRYSYTPSGKTRTCNWCGTKHLLDVREVAVVRRIEKWRLVKEAP